MGQLYCAVVKEDRAFSQVGIVGADGVDEPIGIGRSEGCGQGCFVLAKGTIDHQVAGDHSYSCISVPFLIVSILRPDVEDGRGTSSVFGGNSSSVKGGISN